MTDSTVDGKTITLKIEKQRDKSNSASTVITKKVLMDSRNKTISLKLPSEIGGKSYYKVSVYDGKTALATLAPVAFTSVEDELTNIIVSPQNSDKVKVTPIILGSSEVAITWNNTSLFIVGNGTGKATILLDPANSKQGFLTFSNRYISIDFDNKTVSFNYFDRKLDDNKISYELKDWKGDMKSSIDGKASIEIPWFDLGIKMFEGRTIGMAAYSESTSFPQNLKKYTPSTWGNLIFK
jgi:hypothetical protein